MKIYRTSDKKFLTLKLFDQRSDKFIKAIVFNSNMAFVGNFYPEHVSDGFYSVEIGLLQGCYHVIYEVFKDSGYTKKDSGYSDSEEQIRVERYEELISSALTIISDKIDDNDGAIAT